MLRYGQNYVEQGIRDYKLKFRLERIKWLKKEAQSLDFQFGATKELPPPVPGEMFCFLRLKDRS